MIPDFWLFPGVDLLWRTTLHSFVAASLLYGWSRRLCVPSGRFRRHLHVLVLTIPLVTAPLTYALPGAPSARFRESLALFDSHRILALPLPGPFRVYDGVAALALLTVAISLWQEILPVLRRPGGRSEGVPRALVAQAQSLPGWTACSIEMTPWDEITVATAGSYRHPRLVLSEGALDRLSPPEIEAVIRHENAHWRKGRWRATHLLFGVRLLQIFNPMALWVFREFTTETEIDCDRDAVEGVSPQPLARALLRIYRSVSASDVASRHILRKRIDVLTGELPVRDDPLPESDLVFGIVLLLGVLPWVV